MTEKPCAISLIELSATGEGTKAKQPDVTFHNLPGLGDVGRSFQQLHLNNLPLRLAQPAEEVCAVVGDEAHLALPCRDPHNAEASHRPVYFSQWTQSKQQ